jgi:23S rRNA G2069 N7-methylase RlmK/C1962 C5-methylase RlmI
MRAALERAWQWREARGLLAESDALRIFHGPGEGPGALRNVSVDRFGPQAWVTLWEEQSEGASLRGFESTVRGPLGAFLKDHAFTSAVLLYRPLKGVPENPTVLFGSPTPARFEVTEGPAKFWIQLLETKHPGLFLDHAPLRRWLRARCRNLRVLNTFAYTGSLSVAAGLGGAAHVTTLDLSKPTMKWAEENGALNGLAGERARWIYGDVFEWLPRFKKEIGQGKNALYDLVILDPPSFSRGEKGSFSTAKDLPELHALALDILAPDGLLVTSINSAQIPWTAFERDLLAGAQRVGRKLQVIDRLEQPETFPHWLTDSSRERYLKGYILRAF